MMLTWISPRHLTPALLAVMAVLGLAVGHLTGTVAGIKLTGIDGGAIASQPVRKAAGRLYPELSDYEIIPQRNLFSPDHPGTLAQGGRGEAQPVRSEITLLGTVAGGVHPLALVRVGGESRVLRIGDAVAAGKVVAISRQSLTVRFADGSEQIIIPPELPSPPSGSAPVVAEGAAPARTTGENRKAISRDEADKARANLGELMKQARMEPHVVNGQTDGFEVKMVKPNTLFTTLGIQKGDIIKQVNGLQLDSPEKALQIFQQLREARHIVIALERNSSPMSFEYDLE